MGTFYYVKQKNACALFEYTACDDNTNDWCFSFNRNLRVGDSGDDVLNLQHALGNLGFSVTQSGTLDESTAAAISEFQERYRDQILTPNGLAFGNGYLGATTRGVLNGLIGCK